MLFGMSGQSLSLISPQSLRSDFAAWQRLNVARPFKAGSRMKVRWGVASATLEPDRTTSFMRR
ncbi:MAG TPA: hypothetical protein VF064_07100 [Pyrinomonadaceae bacterium]